MVVWLPNCAFFYPDGAMVSLAFWSLCRVNLLVQKQGLSCILTIKLPLCKRKMRSPVDASTAWCVYRIG